MYERILEMKFITEMLAGSLDREIMAQYLLQDSLYLQQFAKVLALIAARSDDRSVTGAMAKAAHTVWPSEPQIDAPCELRVRGSPREGI